MWDPFIDPKDDDVYSDMLPNPSSLLQLTCLAPLLKLQLQEFSKKSNIH